MDTPSTNIRFFNHTCCTDVLPVFARVGSITCFIVAVALVSTNYSCMAEYHRQVIFDQSRYLADKRERSSFLTVNRDSVGLTEMCLSMRSEYIFLAQPTMYGRGMFFAVILTFIGM